MIEDFEIDIGRGYADQIGLFIKADSQMIQAFLRILWANGFRTVRRNMGSVIPYYDYFTFVFRPDSGLDKVGLQQLLLPLCVENCMAQTGATTTAPDYETWHSQFSTYVQNYQRQQFAEPTQQQAEAFDKAHAFQLIQSKQYEAAESYLQPFARDPLPSLLPAYRVYLYHQWDRLADVRATYEQYVTQLRAGVVNHQVIAWIVEAYLADTQPEQALTILNDYLPEFQRQGVADRLLDLRTQAQALRGQLPQTAPELNNFIRQASPNFLSEKLDDILDIISGMSAEVDSKALLAELETKLAPNQRWLIQVARSQRAQRNDNLPEALRLLMPLLNLHPPVISLEQQDNLRVQVAAFQLQLEQFYPALDTLNAIDVTNLPETNLAGYWSLLGQLYEALNQPTEALSALHQAYELTGLATNQLRRLAQLAYQAGDLDLAQKAYTELFQTEFTPDVQDHIYAGIIAWLEDDHQTAVEYLQAPLLELSPDQPPAEAFEALTTSLIAIGVPTANLIEAVAAWTDHLVIHRDTPALAKLATTLTGLKLEREAIYHLLEPIEACLIDQPGYHPQLAQLYSALLFAEIKLALSRNQAMPGYILDLRRTLLALDEAQFDAAQQYLAEKLTSARESLGQALNLEPEAVPSLDLRDKWVALIGGYENVRRRVQARLTQDYGLTKFTEVAPSWEETVSEKKVRQAVTGADLIVVVHRCLKHDGTDALSNITAGTPLRDRLCYAPGKGHSSIIQAVTGYFSH